MHRHLQGNKAKAQSPFVAFNSPCHPFDDILGTTGPLLWGPAGGGGRIGPPRLLCGWWHLLLLSAPVTQGAVSSTHVSTASQLLAKGWLGRGSAGPWGVVLLREEERVKGPASVWRQVWGPTQPTSERPWRSQGLWLLLTPPKGDTPKTPAAHACLLGPLAAGRAGGRGGVSGPGHLQSWSSLNVA